MNEFDMLVQRITTTLYAAAGILLLVFLAIVFCKLLICLKRSGLSLSTAPEGIIFGKKIFLKVFSPTCREGHSLIVGGTGSGKTSALLIPTLNSWSGTSFNIDISGDISSHVDMPYKLEICPLSDYSVPYSVFGHIDELSYVYEINEALEKLAFLLIPEAINTSENSRFFINGGRNILTAALIAFYHQGMDFVAICEKIITLSWQHLFEDIDRTSNSEARNYINGFQGSNEKNTAGCKQSCDEAVKLFATNYRLKNNLRRPRSGELCFYPEMIERYNVFFLVDDSVLDVMRPLLHLVTAQVMDYFSKRSATRNQPVLLALDEFSSLGKLEIIDALRKYRKRHVRVMILTQSLADLDLVYGKDERTAMLNNFSYKVILSASDVDTQKYFAELIGRNEQHISADGRTVGSNNYKIAPEKLSTLGKNLILIHPQGYTRLSKNYYFS